MHIDVATFFQSIDFTQPTWDLFIILFFVIGAFLYGFSLGRDRIIVILVSIYIALAVISHLPALPGQAQVWLGSGFALKITSFFVLFSVLFFLFARSGLLRTMAVRDHTGRWYHVFFFSILHVGLITSIALSFMSVEYLQNFSQTTRDVFVSPVGRFVWIIAPVLAMAAVKREDKKK